MNQVPPLFNGKVWIGNNYRRPIPNHVLSHDAHLIQSALLAKTDRSFKSFLWRLLS
jgi:hypothetical protein